MKYFSKCKFKGRIGRDSVIPHRVKYKKPTRWSGDRAEVGLTAMVHKDRELCYSYTMTDTDDIVLEHSRHIRGAIDDVRDDIREIKQRVGNLENQYANMSNRLDRMNVRIERIERRLDLADA